MARVTQGPDSAHPPGFVLVLFHVHTRGKHKDREKMEVSPTWVRESLTNSIGLYNHEVHVESMERYKDSRTGLKNMSLSFLLHQVPEITTHQMTLSYSPGLAQPRALEVWVATGRTDRSDAPGLRFMRFKTDTLPLETNTLLSWAAINRVALIEERETKTKNKTRKQKSLPLDNTERLKMIALIRYGQGGQEARRVHTFPLAAHSLRPEVGGSRLAAEWGPLWWSPQATWGYKGKTMMGRGPGWLGTTARFL